MWRIRTDGWREGEGGSLNQFSLISETVVRVEIQHGGAVWCTYTLSGVGLRGGGEAGGEGDGDDNRRWWEGDDDNRRWWEGEGCVSIRRAGERTGEGESGGSRRLEGRSVEVRRLWAVSWVAACVASIRWRKWSSSRALRFASPCIDTHSSNTLHRSRGRHERVRVEPSQVKGSTGRGGCRHRCSM